MDDVDLFEASAEYSNILACNIRIAYDYINEFIEDDLDKARMKFLVGKLSSSLIKCFCESEERSIQNDFSFEDIRKQIEISYLIFESFRLQLFDLNDKKTKRKGKK